MNRLHSLLAVMVLGLCSSGLATVPRWKQLPTPAPMPRATASGYARLNGIQLYYAVYGHGQPVVLLHGGLGNSDYWGNQVSALARHAAVVVIDSRGHGRSTRNAQPYSYELMSSDVLGVMDQLRIRRARLIGWSDGGIVGLVLAIHHPERLSGVFAFGANSDPSGANPDVGHNATFNTYIARTESDYRRLSKTPGDFNGFLTAISTMWANEPHITGQLKTIRVPVTIADGQYDEAILRQHTVMMSKAIPGARLVILPGVSHFAMLQNPQEFNLALETFLNQK